MIIIYLESEFVPCVYLLSETDVHGIMEGEVMTELEGGKALLEDIELQ